MTTSERPFVARDNTAKQARKLVTQLNSNDVLMGRGAPLAYCEGNVKFRALVYPRKVDYVSAKSQRLKQEIAMQVYTEITGRSGRFLHKVTAVDAERQGVPVGVKAWRIVDEITALDKIKQALREKSVYSHIPPEVATSPQPMSMPRASTSVALLPPRPREASTTSSNRIVHQPMDGLVPNAATTNPAMQLQQVQLPVYPYQNQQQRHQQQHNHPQSSIPHNPRLMLDLLLHHQQQQHLQQQTHSAHLAVYNMERPNSLYCDGMNGASNATHFASVPQLPLQVPNALLNQQLERQARSILERYNTTTSIIFARAMNHAYPVTNPDQRVPRNDTDGNTTA